MITMDIPFDPKKIKLLIPFKQVSKAATGSG